MPEPETEEVVAPSAERREDDMSRPPKVRVTDIFGRT
jgi:hypothetical protein